MHSSARHPVCLFVCAASLLTLQCNRTPPEPTPPPAPPSSLTHSTVSPLTPEVTPSATETAAAPQPKAVEPSRCIKALPPEAPKIPAPAGARCPTDPEPNVKMPKDEVSFPDAPTPLKIEVELAKNPHDIERGLMYRRSMRDDQGMLFHLDSRREHTFWMHNTCIALDMLFVDDDGTIVGAVEGASPLTDDVRSVGCPSSYVLEVNGGWVRKHNVRPGQKITIPDRAR